MNSFSFSKNTSLLATLLIALFFVSCEEDNRFQLDFSTVPAPFSINDPVSVDTLDSGAIIYVIEEGSGEFEVHPTDEILFYYSKRYSDDLSDVFSSSYANGVTTPVSNRVTPTNDSERSTEVIKEGQFREAVIGMKEGEKRVIILTPPIVGYFGSPYSYSDEEIWIDFELEGIAQ